MNVLVVMSSMGRITVILSFIFIFILVLLSRWSVDSSSSFCVKTWIKPGCLSPTHSCTDYSKRGTIEWSVVFVLLFCHEFSYFHVFLLGYLQVIHVPCDIHLLSIYSLACHTRDVWLYGDSITFHFTMQLQIDKQGDQSTNYLLYFHIQVLFSPLAVVIHFL